MLQAIGKRVLIKGVEAKQGTIIVSSQKPIQFMVISIGDEVTKVIPGDVIYLEKHYGIEIDHEGQKVSVIDEGSILAKVVIA